MDPIYTPAVLAVLAITLIATGAIAGVLAGLLGVGGGIFIVPVLFVLFEIGGFPENLAMHVAVGTSLATIIPTSISSARSHHAKGGLDVDLLKSWAPYIFLGAALGGIASKYLSSGALTLIFGAIALLVSINMVLPKRLKLADAPPEGILSKGSLASAIGGFSALMGIGGGTLSVPALTMFSFPVHRAVGTAAAFGLVIAVPATLGFIWSGLGVENRPPLSLGYVNVPAAVLIFSASVFTAPLGATLAHKLNAERLRLAFAVFLFISAARMLWSIIS